MRPILACGAGGAGAGRRSDAAEGEGLVAFRGAEASESDESDESDDGTDDELVERGESCSGRIALEWPKFSPLTACRVDSGGAIGR